MLRVERLELVRGDNQLFSGITFSASTGSVFCIHGKNGSGKTSLLKVLANLTQPTVGKLWWQNREILPNDPNYLANIIYIGHKTGIESSLTPLENLKIFLALKNQRRDTQDIEEILTILKLKNEINQPCEYLSRGQRQRVALGRLWTENADCWILDEPFTALDGKGQELLQQHFKEHLQKGGCIILASHIALTSDINFNVIHLGSL